MVDVPSQQLLAMDLVEPGNPTASWLVHKIEGTHTGFTANCVGGSCGALMPIGQPQLDAATRKAIRRWISGGATNDCP